MQLVTNSLGTWTCCPTCHTNAPVHTGQVDPGTLGFHLLTNGVLCEGTGTAVTLAAAIARDGQLTSQESAARGAVIAEALQCRGYDRDGGPCSHTAKARCRREAAAAAKTRSRRLRVAS